jgi:ferritin
MLTDKMQKALNEQINAEYYSAYLYLSMSAYFESKGLKGFANWMRVQYQEELTHAEKIYDFVNEREGRVVLAEIKTPPQDWSSPLAAFEDALEHERKVSAMINELVNLSLEEKDHATNNFLQWFVAEQVEEEASVGEVRDQIRLAGETGGGMFMIDRELGTRTFTPPAQSSGT